MVKVGIEVLANQEGRHEFEQEKSMYPPGMDCAFAFGFVDGPDIHLGGARYQEVIVKCARCLSSSTACGAY
jgi:hypothetical protein